MKIVEKIKTWGKQYDQWAQVRQMHPVLTTVQRVCTNCETEFQGNFCPQCGLKASIAKLKVKNLFQNFLDIWGLGSRPMFRTLRELFTRPGYMISEYLSGHQPLYFPPFKMLVVTTVIYLLAGWVRDVPIDGLIQLDSILDSVSGDASERGTKLSVYLEQIFDWFNDHLAIGAIVGESICVLATRIAFLKAAIQWSLVELFFAHIYLSVQHYIFATLSILLFGAELDELPGWGVLSLVIMLYQWLTLAQLYNMGFWQSLFRTILKSFCQIVIAFALVALLILIVMMI